MLDFRPPPTGEQHDSSHSRISHYLPALWLLQAGIHADRRMPVLLRMRALQNCLAAQGGRLLRLLLVWVNAVSADPGAAHLLRSRPAVEGLGIGAMVGVMASARAATVLAARVVLTSSRPAAAAASPKQSMTTAAAGGFWFYCRRLCAIPGLADNLLQLIR